VWHSPIGNHHYCRFSPDGRWLISDVDGGRLYSAGSWEPGPRLGQGMPWDMTPDGTLAIVGQTNGVCRLVEVAGGRELARLEDPDQTSGPAAFTPDGTRMVVAARNGLRLWDLRPVRAELGKLGLNWDAPPYPALEENLAAPLALVVNTGDLDRRQRIADLTRAIDQSPNDARRWHDRSEYYIHLERWSDAAADMSKALELQPGDAWLWFDNAYLRLQLGDADGYRKLCADMFERFGPNKERDILALAHAWALAPQAPADTVRVRELAEQRLAVTRPPSPHHLWSLHELGLAC
jgi:hypothetical protein